MASENIDDIAVEDGISVEKEEVYAIYEGNMERLEKKLARIMNKCSAYGCEFHYEKVGEEYREMAEPCGRKHTARFILVKAWGKAVLNGWQFAASVEYTEHGNIFSGRGGIEIPERYYNSKPVCEHCGSRRMRRHTFIVMNTETGEFKQVGRNCLCDFTHGLDANSITQYIGLFDELIQGEEVPNICEVENHIKVEDFLAYAAECVRCFGYVKSSECMDMPTGYRTLAYYEADTNGGYINPAELAQIRKEMRDAGFDADSPKTRATARKAVEWVMNEEENGNYMHNLKTVCANEYMAAKNAGLAASLIPVYFKAVEKAEKAARIKAELENDGKLSSHVGTPGDRIAVTLKSVRCVTGWATAYGYMKLYRFTDTDGNIYIWKTCSSVDDSGETDGMKLMGTVKKHGEYEGIMQTELTRCKVMQTVKAEA